ncbi:hypothetical protein EJB05_05308, partial [Eragrostis curvula]
MFPSLILLKFAKDRFMERQPRTTAQSTGLIMVDLVKYYVVFPVLSAFMEWGRKGYFQTQRSKTVMTAVLTIRSGLDPHMIRDGWMDGYGSVSEQVRVNYKFAIVVFNRMRTAHGGRN